MASYLDQDSNERVSTVDGTFSYKPCFPFVYTTSATPFNSRPFGRYFITPLFVIIGPFVAIFRLLSFLVLQTIVWICSIVILAGYPRDQPLRGWRINLYKCVAYPVYFLMQCSWFTFYRIDARRRSPRPIICVSNHVGLLDIFILIMAEGPAFVSKIGVSSIYLLRKPMEALRVIYVRTKKTTQDSKVDSKDLSSSTCTTEDTNLHGSSSTDSIRSSTDLLRERVLLMKENADWRPIHIFPEGTTTTERGLLRFRTSVFRLDTDIQPICLIYRSYNNPAYVSQSALYTLYSYLTNPFCFVKVVYLDPISSRTPTGERKDPRAFADEVGLAMARYMGSEYLPYTNEDAFYFRQKKKDQSLCSKEYLRDYSWIGSYSRMNVLADPGYRQGSLSNVFVGSDKTHCLSIISRDTLLKGSADVVKQKQSI
ncbi:Lysophospholipid acyltransferase [Giardia duodenalis]|uniref:Lysophospholipid acyltransferase n=1 Tax=Giardia intestinalis TaxID=5741 RepID=V6TFE4_GIAIN|nr:Lysophospholipid acyltransferase [Giardia intestinalis]